MEITPTIRAELDRYLKKESLNFSRFGKITGMNRGAISAIVSGNKPISIHQLDQITEAMGLPEGHFYDLFIENFIIDHPPNMRRIERFLYRCVELGKFDAIRRMVGIIMDNRLYSSKLFEIAEDLFAQGQHEAALILYENVAEVEKYQHSERLALCQYRIFTLQIGDDQSRNFRAAAVFEPYVERLVEIDQLDALKDLANVYRSLSQWDKVYKYAKQMRQLGQIQYDLVHNSKRKEQEPQKKLSRPLFVYIAYADLLCANACDAKGDHEQAIEHLRSSADLSWVKESDPDTLHWIKKFQHWAKTNTYVNRLMSGDISVLPDYVKHMAGQQHIFNELLNVIEAANQYNLDVDHILQQFEPQITAYQESSSVDKHSQQFLLQQHARFSYKLAKYSLNKGRYSYGFKFLLNALEKAATINNVLLTSNCSGLFDRFKTHADPETLDQYEKLSQEVWKRNDKKDSFNLDSN